MRTESPRASNASARCDPRNPAPPVMRTRLLISVLRSHFDRGARGSAAARGRTVVTISHVRSPARVAGSVSAHCPASELRKILGVLRRAGVMGSQAQVFRGKAQG